MYDRFEPYQIENAERARRGEPRIEPSDLKVWEVPAFLAGLLATGIFINALGIKVQGVPIYLSLAVAAGCFGVMALIWLLRDLKNVVLVAWLQVLLSVLSCLALFIVQKVNLESIVAFLAACFSGADGLRRTREIRDARGKVQP